MREDKPLSDPKVENPTRRPISSRAFRIGGRLLLWVLYIVSAFFFLVAGLLNFEDVNQRAPIGLRLSIVLLAVAFLGISLFIRHRLRKISN
jgi:uncharacterized membrane protein YhfC